MEYRISGCNSPEALRAGRCDTALMADPIARNIPSSGYACVLAKRDVILFTDE